MKRILAAVGVAASGALGTGIHGRVAPPDESAAEAAAEAAFEAWAATEAVAVDPESIACAVLATAAATGAVCYGLIAGSPYAAGGVSMDRGATWHEFVELTGDEGGAADDTGQPTSVAAGPMTSFGDGTWIVGTDVAAGQYRAPGGSLCNWARLADLSGEDIIVNEFSDTSSQVLVEIEATDVAFETTGCGTWEPIG